IHQQNATVLSADELTVQAQQMEQGRMNLARLLIHSDQGLRVIGGEFIHSMNEGIDLSELIRKNNGEAVQNDTVAQDTAKQLANKLLDCLLQVSNAKDNPYPTATFAECRKFLDTLHFLPNFLQQIVK